MNGYKTRSPHEHYNHSSEPTLMATCYEDTKNSEIQYHHSSGSCNVLQPFNSYPPSYFESQASITQPLEMHPICYDQQHHFNQLCLRSIGGGGVLEFEVESQDSINEKTMLSEPIDPPLHGFPRVEDFDELIKRYLITCSIPPSAPLSYVLRLMV